MRGFYDSFAASVATPVDGEPPGRGLLGDGSIAAVLSDFPAVGGSQTVSDGEERSPFAAAPREVGGRAKRVMDVALATLALVLLLPVILITALLVRIFMGAPVIFAHDRVGRNGKIFKCYKFRSMVRDADEALRRHLAGNPAAAEEWRSTQKLRRDPRVTPLGQALRKSSLDELPQLINVLRGDMSCVGPRPIVREELERYGPYAGAYLCTRPGLTGAWQVSGRSNLSYEARVALDYGYVHGWSVWRDVVIIVRTIPAVLSHDDAA